MEHVNVLCLYKYIIHCIDNQDDLNYFIGNISNKRILNTINSMIDVKKKAFGIFDTIALINKISTIQYKEDIFPIINNISFNDVSQKNAIYRIVNNKPNKKIESNNSFDSEETIVEKKCPHCNHTNKSFSTNPYIICGYSNNGFDWVGCRKDWCFVCNKKLCKKWDENELFLMSNRFHNAKCCEKYALREHLNYDNDFCMCNNDFVDRTIIF